MKSLGGRIPLIIDGGPTERGLESTIVAAGGGPLRLLRPGPIIVEAEAGDKRTIEAPGQLASHYAPAKPLRLGAMSPEKDEYMIGFGSVMGDSNLSPSANLIEAAALLFDLLHRAEESSSPRIAVAPIPNSGLGAAINDRLRRAAS
jgi:L-threonylcarbamoyladenylate synthase